MATALPSAPTPLVATTPVALQQAHVAFFSEDSFFSEALTSVIRRDFGATVTPITRLGALKRTLAAGMTPSGSRPLDALVIDATLVTPRSQPVHPWALAVNAHEVAPGLPLVMLIEGPAMALISMLMCAGVHGIVAKDRDGLPLLKTALTAALADTNYLCPRAKAAVLRAGAVPKLNFKEVQVIRLLAQGLTDPNFSHKSIARSMQVAECTVNTHLYNIRGKLEAYDDAGIVEIARQCGVIE